jgi:N-acetylglucosaminyldiphosphoundecaprenol N-acetyl-beta-D-mannosaminyltransferase
MTVQTIPSEILSRPSPASERPVLAPLPARRQWHTPWRRTFINAVRIDAITECQCIDAIIDALDAGRGGFVVTHNLDHLRRLEADPFFASVCAGADLRVADGMPVVWLSRLLHIGLPQRVAGSSLIYTLSRRAAERGRSVYLLGGAVGTAAAAGELLKKKNPTLKVAGSYCVPFDYQGSEADMADITARLKAANPDIVYVALGSPKQEFLISRLRRHFPQTWWLGVGISFSYVCGHVRQAPVWMQHAGCEWLYRMMQEPRRLASRYLVHDIPFAAWLLARCLGDRAHGAGRRLE